MELWQTAAQELDRLQQVYQQTISDRQLHDAQRQQLKVLHYYTNLWNQHTKHCKNIKVHLKVGTNFPFSFECVGLFRRLTGAYIIIMESYILKHTEACFCWYPSTNAQKKTKTNDAIRKKLHFYFIFL